MRIRPLHFTQAYNLKIKEGDLDFFDTNLVYDSLLFIDPFLLKNSPETEEAQLYDRLTQYFKSAFRKSINARLDAKSALDLLRFLKFPEPKEVNLGYTRASNEGAGLGGDFAKALYSFFMSETAKKVLEKEDFKKEINPEFFVLFADKVAQDGISDLTANLIMDYLVKYTQKQCELLGIETKNLKVNQTYDVEAEDWSYGRIFKLPSNPMRPEEPIILVPKRLLRSSELTKQDIKSKIKGILNSDPILKKRFERIISKPLAEIDIKEIREIMLSDDSVLKQFIDFIGKQKIQPYDFIRDPLEFLTYKKFFDFFTKLGLSRKAPVNCDELLEHVKILIDQFKNQYEIKDSWKDAWYIDQNKNLKPIKEVAWGRAFRAAGDIYFYSYPTVTFDSEVESGRGRLDFRVILKECKITIELKFLKNAALTGNPPLEAYLHGILRQLPGYTVAFRAKYAFYITGQHFRDFRRKGRNDDKRANAIRGEINTSTQKIQDKVPDFKELFYINIDLTPKPSYSKI